MTAAATTQTKTNASPTAATNLAPIGDLVQATAAAYGALSDDMLLVMPPRRYSFIASKLGFPPEWPVPRENIILSQSAIVAGQDRIVAFVRSEVALFTDGPSFRVYLDPGSATLTARVSAWGYAALAVRKPAAVGVSSGTEWNAPTF